VLTPQEISGILDGSHFGPEDRPRFDAGQKMLLGVPAEFPHHITEPLKRYFATRREVKQAYLAQAWIRDVEGEEPHSLIGIVVSGDWEKIEQEAGLVVSDVVQQGELVALMQIRRGDASFIPTYLQRQVKPFYRRKTFGLL
ncbi:MAG TPA: enhanced serine sensitivity protein SseB C-terminal domain-containing protein, partial [Planctomycetaceae bacterium]|jgi:hypothetical protein|nr:enhanced serine sensitivity protein SseB C-terminal domain-containing protein [Planctomycetaceae bacterium]